MPALPALHCSYRPGLVLLSYGISVFGAYCSLQCGVQIPSARGWRLAGWLTAAAVALGGGATWAMHFIAMIACRLPVAVTYDPALTVASLLVAVAVSGLGLWILNADPPSRVRLVAAGTVTGTGIAAMHYTGMAAMRLPARITYQPPLVASSVLIAIGAAMLALWAAFQLLGGWQRLGSAFVMAGAVCGLHYSAMAAAVIVPNRSIAAGQDPYGPEALGFIVAGTTFLVLALLLMASRVADVRRVDAELRASARQLRRSQAELRGLAARLEEVREEESARIARQVHDEIGQTLSALQIDVDWLKRRLAAASPPTDAEQAGKLRSMTDLLDGAMDAVHRITSELRPVVLDELGLEAAIEWYVGELARRTGIACQVRSTLGGAVLDRRRSTALFRILQEALTNVARHAAATHVDVRLGTADGRVVLEVTDDGRGIPEDRIDDSGSLGILGMRERARALGGELDIHRNAGGGTAVVATVPL
jgi:signal transduction histidine kinase